MLARSPARPNRNRQPVSRPFTIPPSVGGLNALDAITDMPVADAILLDNLFPQPDYLEMRRGHASFATGVGSGSVQGVFAWEGMAGRKIKAASATNIYDITAGGTASSEVASLTNGQWQHVIQSNGAGSTFLVIANGADSVRNYDGTSWTTPSITGVTSSTLNNVAVHARRLWFVEKDSTSGWYLSADAIAGAATEFDFGPRFSRGGHLVAIGTMTRDGGNGQDDYLCAISSNGEITVYIGTDPTSASTWAGLGTFYTSPPIGKRCFEQIGGDLGIVTEAGVLSAMSLLSLDRTVQQKAAITSKINRLFTTDAEKYKANYGWQVLGHPTSNMLIVNVPTGTGTARQYVMNALTGGWCRFTGLNASAWAVYDDKLYFGGEGGIVYQADVGYQDAGFPITGDLLTAFNAMGHPGSRKQFRQLRPFYESNGTPGYLMSLNVDFDQSGPTSTPTAGTVSTDVWGTGAWGVATWGAGSGNITKDWQGVANIGTYAAVRMRITTNGASVKIYGFEGLYEVGGHQ